jgi:hypothetical protein
MALRTGCAGQTVERKRNWRNIKQPEEIRKIFPPDQEDRAGWRHLPSRLRLALDSIANRRRLIIINSSLTRMLVGNDGLSLEQRSFFVISTKENMTERKCQRESAPE